MSRIWGGIHVSADDSTGRILGSQCGKGAWALAQKYFDGSVTKQPIQVATRPLNATGSEIRFQTLRGFSYALQSSRSLNEPFTTEPPGFIQALDSSMVRTGSVASFSKFYRVVTALEPR